MIRSVKKDDFLKLLHEELIRHGDTPETADRHIRMIAQTFTPEDEARIEHISDPREISRLAQAIVTVKAKTAKPTPQAPDSEEDDDIRVYKKKQPAPPAVHASAVSDEDAFYADMIRDDEEEGFVPTATRRGIQTFWLIFACSLPLIILFVALYLSVFAILFAALCSLIVLLVAGLIGGVAVGAVISFVCIGYGITQLITVTSAAPGMYEIGLGLIVAGIVMVGGILVYNAAIRLIPLLIRLLGTLFRFCTDKLKDLFRRAKEACYTL